MSGRARRRRARAEALPGGTAVKTSRRLPPLPLAAALIGVALLAAAWTTRWTPGAPRAAEATTRFELAIPQDRQRVINSWERFFICYDLTDPGIVDLTLRANQRATGTLDFPAEKVIVELPSAGEREAERPESGAEEELIGVRRAVLNAAVPERLAAVRQQCAG